jgi:RimJ/RimL family protein N-acetyltransferase
MSDTFLQPADIVSGRLRLRRFRPADAALVELMASDGRVAWMTERVPHPYPPGLAAGFVERVSRGTSDEIGWAIDTETGGGEAVENGLIGTIMLRIEAQPDSKAGTARVGYWLAPAFWGTGYATEALAGVVGFARAAGFRTLTARVFQDNPASVKVLLHAGFAYVDDGETYSLARGTMVPTHNYRLAL